MPKKKSPEDFFRRAREKGSEVNNEIFNGTEVQKHLEDKTTKYDARALDLWNEYAQHHPGADPYDLETLKGFGRTMAYGIDVPMAIPRQAKKPSSNTGKTSRPVGGGTAPPFLLPPPFPSQMSVLGGFHHPFCSEALRLTIVQFINDPLRKELGLAHRKRIRSYGTTNHSIHLGTQLWEKDWQVYDKPRVRVDTWAKIQLYVFTSARVGEYIESTCRAGSGRGLYYRDMTFGVFRNEHGKAKFAIQVVRDAKNITSTPEKRPELSVHEGLEPRPLFCNPVPTMLARAIADNAFRDYSTMEELLDIESPEDEMYHLRQSDGVLNKPFFHVISTGEMEKADTFSRRLRELGVRAGYQVNQPNRTQAITKRAKVT